MKVAELFGEILKVLHEAGAELVESHTDGPDVGHHVEPWLCFEMDEEPLVLQADLAEPAVFIKDWENEVLWRHEGIPGDPRPVLESLDRWLTDRRSTHGDLQEEGV